MPNFTFIEATVFDIARPHSPLVKGVGAKRLGKGRVNPILPGGGGIRHLLFFLHHPKTAKGINLKLSDFRDTPCASQTSSLHFEQNFAPKKSEQSAIFKDVELKFGIETNVGPLSSKSNINLQFSVIMTFPVFRPFC